MLRISLSLLVLLSAAGYANAQSYAKLPDGTTIYLAPGETLASVNGIPYRPGGQAGPGSVSLPRSAPGYACPQCGKVHARPAPTASPGGLKPGEINRNPAAYAWAKREAEFYARGNPYPGRWRGHRYGPGGFGSRGGTGVTMRPNNPNHCYDRRPTSEIVARAVAEGTWRGRKAYFWSAILR